METAPRYALRQRHIKRGFRSADEPAGGAAHDEATTVATVAVGLKPGEMTKLERQLFGSRIKDYLRSRDKILVKWYEDCTHAVDLHQLLADEPDSSMQVLRDAYYFLQENGYINFGVLKERPPPVTEEAAAAAAEEQEADEPKSPFEDDKAIAFKLYELLRVADMETTSEKALRKQLQQHFKTDMNEKKAFIKEHVNYFIQHLDKKDTLEPLGFEGQSALSQQQQREQQKAAAAARAALAAPPAKPSGRVIVVGAGPAGLAAATQLKRNNVDVLVLEARDRVGGRVHSYQGEGFSAPVDLGASLVTGTAPDAQAGLAPDPVSFVCKQLGIQLHELGGELPIFDGRGQKVAPEVDVAVDRLRDELLDAAQQVADAGPQDQVLQQSLGAALDTALQQRLKDTQDKQQQQQQEDAGAGAAAADPAANGAAADAAKEEGGDAAAGAVEGKKVDEAAAGSDKAAGGSSSSSQITPDMLQLLDWHWANLEYGCSASLSQVSLPHWNQDEEWGGFGGPHAMVVGGFDAALKGLAQQLGEEALRLSCPVTRIDYSSSAEQQQQQPDGAKASPKEEQEQDQRQEQQVVKVTLGSGEVLEASLVLVTVPLGVLQQGGVKFVPPLPDWKAAAAAKLGFGDLNKVVMQFPEVFWDPAVNYFGITQPPGEDTRGRSFMFWNLAGFNGGTPLLAALVSGRAARDAEEDDSTQGLTQHTLQSLRRVFGDKVPEPVSVKVTQWASDEFSRGSYSYVAVGCTGQEYDTLALPVSRCVLFAGEHTCKEHPDSVGGAMLSGLREAARVLQLLRGPDAADAAALVSSRTQTLSKTDKRKRAEEAAAEAGAGQGKRQKRDKKEKKESRVKKEKKRGDKKDKGAKGAKQESGSSEQEEEEESEGEQRGGRRGGGGRQRRAAAPQEDPMRRAADRQALRDEMTRLWTGLLDAQQGDCLTVLDVMRSCDSLDGRQQVINAAMKAAPEALSHLSADPVFLSTLNTWLADLVVERSDANLHVLLRVMELLAVLKGATWAGLTASGLCITIKKAAAHRNRDVASKGTALVKDWAARDPSKQKAPAAKKPRLSGAATVLGLYQPSWQPPQHHSERPQQQGKQQQQRQQGKQPQQQSSGGGVGVGRSNGVSPGKLDAFMSEAEREELAAREAAFKEAQAQAAAAAAELAALEAAPAAPSAGRIKIESFGEFQRSSKRQRDDGGDEQAAPHHKHHTHQHHEHHENHHHHHHQPHHQHSSRHGSGGGGHEGAGAAAAGAAGGEMGPEAKARATKQLSDFVKASLKPRFQAKEVDNDDCKWLLQKVVSKVMDATTGADTATDDFMTGKRVSKVNALIESYVAKRRAERKAGGGGDKGKRPSGAKVSATAPTP